MDKKTLVADLEEVFLSLLFHVERCFELSYECYYALTHVCFTLKISPFNVCVNFTKVGICDLIKLANKPNNNMSIKFR